MRRPSVRDGDARGELPWPAFPDDSMREARKQQAGNWKHVPVTRLVVVQPPISIGGARIGDARRSVHEQVRLPFTVDRPHQVLDEGDVVGAERLRAELHVRFVGRSVSLPVVAADTGADQVLPGIAAAARFRNDVIDRQWRGRLTAVDTAVIVPSQNVLPGQLHLLVRHMDIERQAYHTGIGICRPYGVDRPVGACRHHFSLAEPEKDDRLLNVADAQRLVILVEDQNLAVERRATGPGGFSVGYGTERSEWKPPLRVQPLFV